MGFDRAQPSFRHLAKIVGACLVTYYSTLDNFFLSDDFSWIATAKRAAVHPTYIFGWTPWGGFRPIYTLSFLLNYMLSGLDPFGYHLFNLLIHTANAILVYFLFRRVSGKETVSLAAALLFSVSASHVGSVAWVSARGHLLGSLFYLSSFLLFFKGGLMRALSAFLYVVSMMSIESTFTLPLLLVAFHILIQMNHDFEEYLKSITPFFILMAAYIYLQYTLPTLRTGNFDLPSYMFSDVFSINFIPRNLIQAISILWMPFKYEEYVSRGSLSSEVQIAFAISALLFILSLYILLKGSTDMRFAIAWIYITLLPFLFLTSVVWPRHLYLTVPGFSFIVAILIKRLVESLEVKSGKGEIVAMAMVLLALMVPNVLFNIDQHDNRYNSGLETRNIVETLLSNYPEFPSDAFLVLVNFPEPGLNMEYIIYTYYDDITVEVAANKEEFEDAVRKGLHQGKNVRVLYYDEGKILELLP